MKLFFALLRALACVMPLAAAGAAQRGEDQDWPCVQRLVPVLSAGTMWNGPSIEGLGDWHAEPAVAALVRGIAPRSVSPEEGEAAIAEFTHGLSGDRQRLITMAFVGLLDETNRERGEIIQRIKLLGERQRGLSDLVARLTAQLDAMPEKPGEPSPERTELADRWSYTSRAYNEVQRTMRYACEVPGQLDARLGAYARALEAALS